MKNNNIHHEFAYQSRELGIQIEDTLGDPPDHRQYARVIAALIGEYAKGTGIDDVNMLSFALADHLRFDDPAGLLAECRQYDKGNAKKVVKMVSCADAEAGKALAAVSAQDPELARKAILTAFLYKNNQRWSDEEQPFEDHEEDDDDKRDHDDFDEGEDSERAEVGQDVIDLFDKREEGNG
ncbi:MAG TPA: hypothetical protein VGD24_00295 [Gallionella sp.]